MAIEVGNVFEGRVTGVKPFGAFVALPEGRVFDVFVGKALEAEEIGVFIQLVHVFIIVPHGSVLRRGRKDSAHVIDIFVQGQRLRKFAAFQNLLPFLMLVLAQQLRHATPR